MRLSSKMIVLTLALGTTALSTAGCSRLKTHQGYIIDPVVADTVQPGIDTKESVQASMGSPTFAGQFDQRDWYYVSRNMRQVAFGNPKPKEQRIMHVRFDKGGNVVAVNNYGMENVVNISPEGDKTPTMGSEKGFFADLFSNIGSVGGVGGVPGNDPTKP